MITDGKKWHYLVVKCLSTLFRGITSKHEGDFYCSYRTENKLKKRKKVCENHDYCYVEMPEEDNKISKYNQREKYIIYANLESLLEKMNASHSNPEKSSTTKINSHHLVIHCLHTVHLMQQKVSLITIEAKIV